MTREVARSSHDLLWGPGTAASPEPCDAAQGLGRLSDRLVPAAHGRVLEIGIGSGLNLPFYGSGVREIVGLDPSVPLLRMAKRRVARGGVARRDIQPRCDQQDRMWEGSLAGGCGQAPILDKLKRTFRALPYYLKRKAGEESLVQNRRELYRSPNGDVWFLARDPVTGRAFVIHEPNLPSGGRRAHIEIGSFLRDGGNGPEHQALLRLIGSLVDTPPSA